jgi:hypothetical protein
MDADKEGENKMDKTTKTILIVLGSLFLVCACGASVLFVTGAWSIGKVVQWADQNTTENPQEVAEIASGIADFDVPAGFDTQYGMKLGDFTMVQYMRRDEKSIVFVTQFPAGTSIDMDEMMRQVREGGRDPNSPWYNMDTTLLEQKPVTIHGAETTLSISEGTTKEGVLYRMANATFQGNGKGPALFMIVGPADQWNSQLVEEFIASIR